MFQISDIKNTAPARFATPLQERVYAALDGLHIPFERVDTDEAITMEDCVQINQKLGMEMVKTLFLSNRQQTEFYLFVTTAAKQFKSKDFSSALGIPRVSFAPAELMKDMLGTDIGAATVLSVLLDGGGKVRVVLDSDVVAGDWYGCSDGTTTGYMKIKTAYVVHDFLNYASHQPTAIQI